MTNTLSKRHALAMTSEFSIIEGFDPLSVFSAYRATVDDTDSYLLESVSGPEVDARASVIGFAPLFSLEMNGCQVAVSGEGSVVERVLQSCERGGFSYDGQLIHLDRTSDIWPLLRSMESAFDLSMLTVESWEAFGWFGYLGYDIAGSIEELPRHISDSPGHPDLRLAIFQGEVVLDHGSGAATLRWFRPVGYSSGKRDERMQAMRQALTQFTNTPHRRAGSVPEPVNITTTVSQDAYENQVRTALEYIARGDIYQVQLGQEVRVQSDAEPLEVYRRLRERNPSPYMYFASVGDTTLIGASPELFVRNERTKVTMRPIAGTKPAGFSRSDFLSDEKELAEHIMLVDLCRNDLSRIIETNSLQVESLLNVEAYSHVAHLVSTVSGRARPDTDKYDIIASGFPAGTMTGAPKIRAMEIIEELESSRRGLYAGAVGRISFSGEVNLALCIRSVFLSDGTYSLRASAGVVADSTPTGEYEETWQKMAACLWAVTGREVAR